MLIAGIIPGFNGVVCLSYLLPVLLQPRTTIKNCICYPSSLKRNCNRCTSLQLSGAEVALLLNRPNFNTGKSCNYKGSLLLIDERRFFGEPGWRSGDSTRLPPINVARVRFSVRCHMWVEFVVGSRPFSKGVSPGSPVFLPPQKPTFPNSIWNQWTKSHSVEVPLQIPIYYFILSVYFMSGYYVS